MYQLSITIVTPLNDSALGSIPRRTITFADRASAEGRLEALRLLWTGPGRPRWASGLAGGWGLGGLSTPSSATHPQVRWGGVGPQRVYLKVERWYFPRIGGGVGGGREPGGTRDGTGETCARGLRTGGRSDRSLSSSPTPTAHQLCGLGGAAAFPVPLCKRWAPLWPLPLGETSGQRLTSQDQGQARAPGKRSRCDLEFRTKGTLSPLALRPTVGCGRAPSGLRGPTSAGPARGAGAPHHEGVAPLHSGSAPHPSLPGSAAG